MEMSIAGCNLLCNYWSAMTSYTVWATFGNNSDVTVTIFVGTFEAAIHHSETLKLRDQRSTYDTSTVRHRQMSHIDGCL